MRYPVCCADFGKNLGHIVLSLSLLICFGRPMHAQTASSTEGTIVGSVTDATGAALAGAKVTLIGPTVMGTPTTVSNEKGEYRFPALAPGDYKLTFDQPGFGRVVREGVHVRLGFTATVNVELQLGAVQQNITVSDSAPPIDVESSTISTSFDSHQLANLPGSRDYWGVLAQMPAISMNRVDVGGSGALTQQPYTAYGLVDNGGVNRGMVEGIMVVEGSGGGGSDMYYTDYAAFTEIAVNAVGNTAEMPNPGVLSQLVAKSGSNGYHGDVYFDYESDAMEATNIDNKQIARGLTGTDVVPVHDLNRLAEFRDFSADLGGYVIKDKLWWYGAYRHTVTDQRYPTLLDDSQRTPVNVYTAKVDYNLTQNQRISGFYQHQYKQQPDYLGAVQIGGGRQSPALMHKDSVWASQFPVTVWKLGYTYAITPTLLLELRAGEYASDWGLKGKSALPRVEDIGNNFVSGGLYETDYNRHRPQLNGSLTYTKSGWLGTHTFKFGGEYMRDTLSIPFGAFSSPCDCVSVLNNGQPLDVFFYQRSISKGGNATTALYFNDTWRLSKRLVLNLGIRWDHQNIFLPAQTGPDGLKFAAVNDALIWNNYGPRVGLSYDASGNGKTVVKASFGQFFVYPGADFGVYSFNPNPPGWYKEYTWVDSNANGHWDPGEEQKLIAVSGGSAYTTLDPHLKNTYNLQGSAYLEQQVGSQFTLRTGFVWNGRREVQGVVNINQPFSAFNVPVTVNVPAPNGDPGPKNVTAYDLSPAYASLPFVNQEVNLPVNSNYYTWEVTAVRRQVSGRWSLLASFAKTWSRESALFTGLLAGNLFTPNQLINTDGGLNLYTNWQAKLNSTIMLPWGVHLTPVVRIQSGVPFGRTFYVPLSYGYAGIQAETYHAERTATVAPIDLRAEKQFTIHERYKLTGFFDVYNISNTNAEQAVSTTTGSSFLYPSAITPPRIARVGVKFEF
jgi:outer membrane receptor protein involved in Fe transport